ncbi:DUF397 domain-containing protein [Streptomyces sp. NPDC052225]|uniref:DUF397 domain-containing protein n=1 Tax=Streptomyces sp. NPDC052225 TaxID=3154949 RepID=UPI003418A8A3
MEHNQQLTGATWRKSSYSGNTGGDCVEVADLTARVALRDSKNPDGGAFTVAPGAFASFIRQLASGHLYDERVSG